MRKVPSQVILLVFVLLAAGYYCSLRGLICKDSKGLKGGLCTSSSISPKHCPGTFRIVSRDNSYFYVFSLESYKNKLYAFLSEAVRTDNLRTYKPPAVKVLSPDKTEFLKVSQLPEIEAGNQVRGVYNDDDVRLFLAVKNGGTCGGSIYVTKDMQRFERVYSTTRFGIRSFIKFRGVYLAGTDGGGCILGSRNGRDWDCMVRTGFTDQLNAMAIFKDSLYFVDNEGVSRTADLKTFQMVFRFPKGNTQAYAVHVTPELLYVGTGWDPSQSNRGHSNVFISPDGVNYLLQTKLFQSPMVYFLAPLEKRKTDFLWGGYTSGGIYYFSVVGDANHKVLDLPGQSPYTYKKFEGDTYISTYGDPAQVISYSPAEFSRSI